MLTHVALDANWTLMKLTSEICDVNPFLDFYQPVCEIHVARCCTVWTDQNDSSEYLLVGDQMLWFGTLLPNSLINPNQLRVYGLDVNDDLIRLARFLASTAIMPLSLSIPQGQLYTLNCACQRSGRKHTCLLY
jgi:hypothetical protein